MLKRFKHFNTIFALIMFLTVLIIFASSISSVKAVADVDILSHIGHLDSLGYYHVVGEVQNVGDKAVNYVKITGTFYNLGHIVIATDFTYTELNVLLVGRKSPFDLLLFDTGQSAQVDHYSLSVTFLPTSPLALGLEILSNSSYIDGIGWMHVVGEIKNIGSVKATYVKVITTYYNEAGGVVDTEFTFSDPIDIDPNQTAPFDVILTSSRVPYVDRYELTAESSQYAIVPELSSMLIPTLFMLVTLLIIMVRYNYHGIYRKKAVGMR